MRYVIVGLAALAVSCGGGGGGGPAEQTIVLKPVAGLSGGVSSVPSAAELSVAPVGDDGEYHGHRIVQRFSLASIPAGAEILSATYQNEQLSVEQGPYGALGDLRVIEHPLGGTLDVGDYEIAVMPPWIGTLSSGHSLGVKTLDVTSEVRDALDLGETRLDLMLLFETETDYDLSADYASFYAAAQPGDVPAIVVRYRP